MTLVQPTLAKPNPPSLDALLAQHKRDVLKSVNCARVGVIESFDASSQTATVKIAQQQVTSISPQGIRTIQEYPLLLAVPVVFTGGGGYTLTFPIAQGDECLVIFNDREIDNWLANGAGTTPTTGRVHDLSDGICIVGLRSNPRALANVSTTAVQLRSDNYTGPAETGELITVAPGMAQMIADAVTVHARTRLAVDCDGTGFVITPGNIETFSNTGSSSDSNPPGPL
jgi:hypothetical protein